MPRPFVHREGKDDGAVDHAGEHGRLLGFAASEAQGAGAHEGGSQERRGRQVFPKGLEDEAEGKIAKVGAPMGFRHKDAGPTHFHHALPSVAHDGAVGFAVAHGAELRDREFVPDPSFGLIPNEGLFFR